MKRRKLAVISLAALLGIAAAGLAIYTNYSVKASVPSLPDVLGTLPEDCQFVFGINVQKFTSSPAYARLRQSQSQPVGKDMAEFIEKTGVDPARDVYYLVAAGRAKEKLKGEGVAVLTGQFQNDSIVAYIRSKTSPVELEYGGSQIFMFPEAGSDTVRKGIALLNDREVAVGDLESLKAVLDVRSKGSRSVLNNPAMAPLLNSISSDEMLWFAADGAGAIARAPAAIPLEDNLTTIRSVVGTLDISEAVVGKITVSAVNEDSAMKLAEVARGFVALTQLGGNKNPDLMLLLDGLKVTQNATQVILGINFPVDLLEKLQQARRPPGQPAGN